MIYLLTIVIILVLLFIAKQWGKDTAKKKMAEKRAKEVRDDSKISSRSNIDDPLDRM